MITECTNLIQQDLQHIWHPCSQMKDYQDFPPLIIHKAKGSYIYLQDGKRVIDAISSWWCKSLGHGHPRLQQALLQQSARFEHVIFANTTHETIVELSKKLVSQTQTLKKIFYASEGSSAIEIAMKMSLHARQITGESTRQHFMALANGYHGETGLALSVSDLGIYRAPYQKILLPVTFIKNIPYVTNCEDPLWNDCDAYWPDIEAQLNQHAETLTAIIVEPILQGAGGMLIYSQDFLKRLRHWTQKNNVHLIADEIMTGFGRTGLTFAYQHAKIEPDFLCLGKGLTSGWLPMSVMMTTDAIYSLFYNDYHKGKNFLHSHTHSGNALAAAVALECLKVLEEENIYKKVQTNEKKLRHLMDEIAVKTGKLNNVRNIGAMVAADLIVDGQERAGFKVFQQAVKLGAFLRPLGNTIYWLPPLNVEWETLLELQRITLQAIDSSLRPRAQRGGKQSRKII